MSIMNHTISFVKWIPDRLLVHFLIKDGVFRKRVLDHNPIMIRLEPELRRVILLYHTSVNCQLSNVIHFGVFYHCNEIIVQQCMAIVSIYECTAYNKNFLDIQCSSSTNWGRVTHKCVSKMTITGSDNGCRLVGAKPLPELMLIYF